MEERLLDGGQPAGLPVSGSVTLTERVKAFFDERVYQPFMNVVKSGITPEKLALSMALGITCGLWPIPGTTAILCLLATLAFRVNKIVAQVLNLVLAPVELLCIPLFYRVGAWSLGSDPIPFSAKEMVEQLRKDFFGTLGVFKDIIFRSMLGWVLLCVPMTLLFYGALWPATRVLVPRLTKGSPSAAYQTMDADVEESFMLDDDDLGSDHDIGPPPPRGTAQRDSSLPILPP